jgi:hypothetical protein
MNSTETILNMKFSENQKKEMDKMKKYMSTSFVENLIKGYPNFKDVDFSKLFASLKKDSIK